MPVTLWIACILGSAYFTNAARMLYLQVRELYKLLLENKRLISEMKRVLEIFPHGVIIQSRTKKTLSKIHFSNQDFQSQICYLKDDIKELRTIKVLYKKSQDANSKQIKSNLCDFILSQENKLKGVISTRQASIKIIKPRAMRIARMRSDNSEYSEEIDIFEGKQFTNVCIYTHSINR
jgi:hypothetical protein